MLYNAASFIRKKYIKMVLAATIFTVVETAMNIIDVFVIGRLVGEVGLSAFDIVLPLIETVIFLANVISIGTGILYTRATGNFDKDYMSKLFGQGLIVSVILGVLVFIAFSLFGGTFFSSYNLSDEILSEMWKFIRYYKYSFFLTPVFFLLSELIYSDGDDKLCAVSSITQLTVKLVLSVYLGMKMGMEGVGLASLISIFVALLVLLPHFGNKSNTLKFRVYLNFKSLLKVIRYSLTDAFTYLFLAISQGLINGIITKNYGERYLSVYAIIVTVTNFWVVFDGVGTAMTPLYNSYSNEKNHIGQSIVLRNSYITAMIEGIIYTGVCCIFTSSIVRLIGVTDSEIAGLSIATIRIVALSSVIVSLLYCVTSYLLLLDKILFGIIISALNNMICPVVLSFVLSQVFGFKGIWIAITVSSLLVGIVSFIYLFISNKHTKCKSDKQPEINMHSLRLSLDSVNALNDSVEEFLITNEITDKKQKTVRFLLEEILLLILDRNNGKKVHAECSVIVSDVIDVIIRDDGVILDITNPDLNIRSFREYVVVNIIYDRKNSDNIITTGFNKNIFRISLT